MKKTLPALIVLILFVSTLSYGVASWCIRRSTGVGVADLNNTAWLRRELKLTDAQTAEIDKLNKNFQAKIDHCCDVHCDARMALGAELAKPQVDLTKASACVDRMAAAQGDSERATLDHILRVRALLTPEQQQGYAALVSQQVCAAGPFGMRHPTP
ncbi:MAG TPA: Spy/CpxP family protein refolding chaperone [Verrucomicrobiae bacterium]|nr:Spy/CpxP family protein refolding chaperone [Verrucomicrobiae bacterium]